MPIFAYISLIVSLNTILSVQQDNSYIDWSPSNKLTWADFQAEPDKNSSVAALTSTNIKIDFGYANATLQYHIRCRFDKAKSWGRVKNDYILMHEQAHFDIAEIYARKLNKALKKYTPDAANISKEVNKIYNDMMQEYYDRQDEYDKETNFSINHTKQAEWLKKISDELSDLKEYAHYN